MHSPTVRRNRRSTTRVPTHAWLSHHNKHRCTHVHQRPARHVLRLLGAHVVGSAVRTLTVPKVPRNSGVSPAYTISSYSDDNKESTNSDDNPIPSSSDDVLGTLGFRRQCKRTHHAQESAVECRRRVSRPPHTPDEMDRLLLAAPFQKDHDIDTQALACWYRSTTTADVMNDCTVQATAQAFIRSVLTQYTCLYCPACGVNAVYDACAVVTCTCTATFCACCGIIMNGMASGEQHQHVATCPNNPCHGSVFIPEDDFIVGVLRPRALLYARRLYRMHIQHLVPSSHEWRRTVSDVCQTIGIPDPSPHPAANTHP